jgi:hypothetical protein
LALNDDSAIHVVRSVAVTSERAAGLWAVLLDDVIRTRVMPDLAPQLKVTALDRYWDRSLKYAAPSQTILVSHGSILEPHHIKRETR